MTRKDYILIAEILIEILKHGVVSDESLFIDRAANKIQEKAPSFDRQKFRNYILKRI